MFNLAAGKVCATAVAVVVVVVAVASVAYLYQVSRNRLYIIGETVGKCELSI